jgi:hypothetical protein
MNVGLIQVFLLLLPGVLSAQQLGARASVDSTTYLIGDPIVVHLDVTHPKGAALSLAVGDSIDGFLVLNHTPFGPIGETSSSASLVLARYDSGTAVVPPVEVICSVPGDTTVLRATTNPLILTIRTVSVDTSQAYRDLKPPLSIPLTLGEIALYAGIVLAVAAIIYAGYRYWKKRQKKATGEVYIPPSRPAHAIALEELAILKEKKLWQKGLIKQYYSEVTEIIRRYIENRFKVMALEQTTDEIMSGLKRLKIKQSASSKVETLLQLADLVKFAKYQPGISEHEEMLGLAHDIVEATKVREVAPPPQTSQKVVAGVES